MSSLCEHYKSIGSWCAECDIAKREARIAELHEAERARQLQPKPRPNDMPAIADMVLADMLERKRVGIERYGVPLQPFNGRDALRDLYEELLDACVYIRQVMFERDNR